MEKKEKWREKLEQFKQDDRYDYLIELLLPYTAGFRAGSLDRGFLPILCEVEELLDKAREEGRKHMQGWECPKCGSVYSPLTFECTSCKNSGIKVRTSDKTSGYDNTSYLN